MRSFVLVLCTLTMATAADRPGETFSVDPANLPRPFATPPADNGGNMIARPNGSVPQVPPGFAVANAVLLPSALARSTDPFEIRGDIAVAPFSQVD